MTDLEPATTRGRRTQARLLDAAIDVLERKGYHAMRVDDIVKAARTSHGTFYLYFANKEALFRHLIGDVAGEFEALADSLQTTTIADGTAPHRELIEWVASFCGLYNRRAAVVRAWTEISIPGDDAARRGEHLLTSFVDGFRTHYRSTHPDASIETSILAAASIMAMLERTSYYALIGRLRGDVSALATSLAHSIVGILVSTPTPT